MHRHAQVVLRLGHWPVLRCPSLAGVQVSLQGLNASPCETAGGGRGRVHPGTAVSVAVSFANDLRHRPKSPRRRRRHRRRGPRPPRRRQPRRRHPPRSPHRRADRKNSGVARRTRGPRAVDCFCQHAGVYTRAFPFELGLALGQAEVTPLEMAQLAGVVPMAASSSRPRPLSASSTRPVQQQLCASTRNDNAGVVRGPVGGAENFTARSGAAVRLR